MRLHVHALLRHFSRAFHAIDATEQPQRHRGHPHEEAGGQSAEQHTLPAIEAAEQIDKAKRRHQIDTGFAQEIGQKTRRSRQEQQAIRAHACGRAAKDLHPVPENIPAHAYGHRQRKHPHELTHHAA